ncbi:hypothetical protein [Vibrio sp.]|uniref:hypothetical protein n=1 Tax=Vibrio sp. TaxID=678 RepID=UPI003D0AC32F
MIRYPSIHFSVAEKNQTKALPVWPAAITFPVSRRDELFSIAPYLWAPMVQMRRVADIRRLLEWVQSQDKEKLTVH